MNELLETARFCHRLSTGLAEENEHFVKKVKPLIGELIELIGTLQESVGDLQKKVQRANLDVGEYKTRAESQEKRNQKLVDELQASKCEIARLKSIALQAVVRLQNN